MIDARRIEEVGLNALQTQRQLFYDGWLLRVSPGKAKRARSVNAHFGSTLPIATKIAYCERLNHSPLDGRHVVALVDGVPVAAGKSAREGDVVGVFDVVTDEAMRGQGIATALVARLLARAWDRGARVAYLQVDAANAPALAVYRRFGFATLYTYHYLGREGECR